MVHNPYLPTEAIYYASIVRMMIEDILGDFLDELCATGGLREHLIVQVLSVQRRGKIQGPYRIFSSYPKIH